MIDRNEARYRLTAIDSDEAQQSCGADRTEFSKALPGIVLHSIDKHGYCISLGMVGLLRNRQACRHRFTQETNNAIRGGGVWCHGQQNQCQHTY